MSFKLVDNPGSSENKIRRKNRAQNIVKERIPKDEYKISRSGKFACLVCPSWPVFDTVVMLETHRTSKRHEHNKLSWDNLVLDKHFQEQKRVQTLYVQQNVSSKLPERKEIPLITQTKNIVRQILDNDSNEDMRELQTSHVTGNGMVHTVPLMVDCSVPSSDNSSNLQHAKMSGMEQQSNFLLNSNSTQTHSRKRKADTVTFKAKESKSLGLSSTMSKEDYDKVMDLKHEIKLREAGWIKDLSGKWIKDENCEFDTDEEDPT